MIAIIGAGPIGLGMAVRLINANLPFVILEKGPSVGWNMLDWGHIHLFTSWEDSIDPVSHKYLKEQGIDFSLKPTCPTGAAYVDEFLAKLAKSMPSSCISFESEVKTIDYKPDTKVFEVSYQNKNVIKTIKCKVVLDASGNWTQPNTIIKDQHLFQDKIYSGIPDSDHINGLPSNSSIAVLGSGHSAMNSLVELTKYSEHKLHWLIRGEAPKFGKSKVGGKSESLENKVDQLIKDQLIELHTGFSIESLQTDEDGLYLRSTNRREPLFVNRLISNIGAFPDYSGIKNFDIEVDENFMIAPKMIERIDPRIHSCNTVSYVFEDTIITNVPYYVIGMKSFGKASNFLLSSGFKVLDQIVGFINNHNITIEN